MHIKVGHPTKYTFESMGQRFCLTQGTILDMSFHKFKKSKSKFSVLCTFVARASCPNENNQSKSNHLFKWSFFRGVPRSRNGPGPLGHGWDPSYISPSHPKGFWPRTTNGRDMGIFLTFAHISLKIENINKRLFGVLFWPETGQNWI